MGALFKNTATFPISYIVKHIVSNADATVPDSGTMLSTGGTVDAGQEGSFFDRPITLKVPKSQLASVFEIEVLYGRAGAERYPLRRKISTRMTLDVKTGVVNAPWADVAS